MRARWDHGRGKGLALFALIAAIACAFGTLATPAAGQATNEQPVASEVGVTSTEIHIAVVADVDNPFAPGANAGARDAVLGFGKFINNSCADKGRCLAGRRLVVDFYDSHLDPNETRNAQIQACTNDFAMVGTTAVLLTSVDEMRNCKDKVGATVGIPDIPVVAAPVSQQCSDESFAIFPDRAALRHQGPAPTDLHSQRRPRLLLHQAIPKPARHLHLHQSVPDGLHRPVRQRLRPPSGPWHPLR